MKKILLTVCLSVAFVGAAYAQGVPRYPYPSAPTYQPSFYVTPRLGYGGTYLPSDDVGALTGGIAIGAIMGNVRADVEFGYHAKREIDMDIDYAQYDVSFNIYFDIPTGTPLTPFVGFGIGSSTSELTLDTWNYIYSQTHTNLMLSAQVGASIELNSRLDLEVMGRYRYLDTNGDVYNVEGLVGFRVKF